MVLSPTSFIVIIITVLIITSGGDAVTCQGFAKSNVSTAVETLKEEGGLSMEPDSASRRIKRLVLGASGNGNLGGWQSVKLMRVKCSAWDSRLRRSVFLPRMDENAVNALEKLKK